MLNNVICGGELLVTYAVVIIVRLGAVILISFRYIIVQCLQRSISGAFVLPGIAVLTGIVVIYNILFRKRCLSLIRGLILRAELCIL